MLIKTIVKIIIRFVRRILYIFSIIGLLSHSIISHFFLFKENNFSEEIVKNIMIVDLTSIIVGFILCAAIIETWILITQKELFKWLKKNEESFLKSKIQLEKEKRW